MPDVVFYATVTVLMLANCVLLARRWGIRSPLFYRLSVGPYFLSMMAFHMGEYAVVAKALILIGNLFLTSAIWVAGRGKPVIRYDPLWVVLKEERRMKRAQRKRF